MTLAIPVFATATAAVFIDESVSVTQAAGMAIVICALSFVVMRTSRAAAALPEIADMAEPPAT